jgi:hypothetical protein
MRGGEIRKKGREAWWNEGYGGKWRERLVIKNK